MDWTITVPLKMIKFNLILKAARKPVSAGMFWRLLLGAIAMLAFGYAGETGVLETGVPCSRYHRLNQQELYYFQSVPRDILALTFSRVQRSKSLQILHMRPGASHRVRPFPRLVSLPGRRC